MFATLISLSWKLFCLLILTLLVKWYRERHLSRPLAWTSLTDFTNLDLVWHYWASCTIFAIIMMPLELGLTLNKALAQFLVLWWSFHIHCTLLSLTATVVVKYLHNRRMSTSICIVFNDVEASIFIRMEIIAMSLFFQGLKLSQQDQGAMYAALAADKDINGDASLFSSSISVILCLLSMFTNVTLRILMKAESSKTDLKLGYTTTGSPPRTSRRSKLSFFLPDLERHLLVALTLFVTFTLTIVRTNDDNSSNFVESFTLMSHLTFFFVCAIIPSVCMLNNRSFVKWIRTKWKRSGGQ